MSDATAQPPWLTAAPAKDMQSATLPKFNPVPVSAPVLIGDAVTPIGQGTLLGLLMQKAAETEE